MDFERDPRLSDPDDDPYYWAMGYCPLFFNPPLDIFKVPACWGEATKREIRACFRVFWFDPAACANHLRTAIALLLTERKVPCYSRKDGKRNRLTLHHRIERLPEGTEEERNFRESLLAVKWIGNEGSHVGRLTRSHILDAFAVLEHEFDEEYKQRAKSVKKLREEIIKHKGPKPTPKFKRGPGLKIEPPDKSG
jgi:hypothetical protein